MESQPTGDFDPAFDPLTQADQDGLGMYTKRLSESVNRDHYDSMVKQIDKEQVSKDVIARSGFWKSLGAGVVSQLDDPLALAGLIAAPELGVAKSIGFFVVDQALRESLLHQTQITRTTEESVVNTLVAGTFGGAFSALVPGARAGSKFLSKKLSPEAQNELTNSVIHDTPNTTFTNHDAVRSAHDDLAAAEVELNAHVNKPGTDVAAIQEQLAASTEAMNKAESLSRAAKAAAECDL